jgi:predicted nuclease of predicted toxin-antitoxin system
VHLLVDEDSQAKTLVRLLREAGHDVLTAEAAGLNTLADPEVLGRAAAERRVLLTRNCADFLALNATIEHAGILAIYQDAAPEKNMSYTEIVQSIGNLEAARLPLDGEFIVLNAWRW